MARSRDCSRAFFLFLVSYAWHIVAHSRSGKRHTTCIPYISPFKCSYNHNYTSAPLRGACIIQILSPPQSLFYIVVITIFKYSGYSETIYSGYSVKFGVVMGESCYNNHKFMLNCYYQLSSSAIFRQYGVSQSECKIDRPRPGLSRLSSSHESPGNEVAIPPMWARCYSA